MEKMDHKNLDVEVEYFHSRPRSHLIMFDKLC